MRLESAWPAMLDTADTEPLPSAALQELYGAGYFRGENSGFSSEGYDAIHATWGHWMDFVRSEVGPRARWLDVGCAFGFLVVEARQAGFRAIGIDASRFAAAQARRHAPLAAGYVACGHAERLPFADGSLDVVSAFDLLEHVPHPERVIAEAARVLRDGGLLLAATPDPLHFDRVEPTHVAERVPSWWVRVLERHGFGVALRFFQADYNCELVARRARRAPALSFDALGAPDPVLCVAGEPQLRAALRTGFGALREDGTRIVESGATVYLLNTGRAPLEVSLEVETAEPGSVDLRLDGRVVVRHRPPADAHEPARSTSRAAGAVVACRLALAAGGHRLRLELERGWARLVRLTLHGSAADREALILGLPFDLYERYALTAEVARIVAPGATRLLDVGGTMGGDGGHLAWTGDFFPGIEVAVVDTRGADYPEHVRVAQGARLPFADRELDLVVSLDVLEHVPGKERRAWLEELWRVSGHVVVLGGPFATPGVVEADRYLFELIRARYGYEHGFLAEHLAHGHPDLEGTRRFFEDRGASVAVLPSGYLPAWVLMQTVNAWLSHPEQDESFPAANRVMNRAVGLASTAPPAYRHLLVIDRTGRGHQAELAPLVAAPPPDVAAVTAALRVLPSVAGLSGAAREVTA